MSSAAMKTAARTLAPPASRRISGRVPATQLSGTARSGHRPNGSESVLTARHGGNSERHGRYHSQRGSRRGRRRQSEGATEGRGRRRQRRPVASGRRARRPGQGHRQGQEGSAPQAVSLRAGATGGPTGRNRGVMRFEGAVLSGATG